MNENVLFRGKRLDDGTWAYGDLIESGKKFYIHPKCNFVKVESNLGKIIVMHEVDPKTIGQFTGKKDIDGKQIFEGDQIRRDFEVGEPIYDPVSLGLVDFEIKEQGYFIGTVKFRASEGFVLNKCKKYSIDGELLEKKSGVKLYPDYAKIIGNIYNVQDKFDYSKISEIGDKLK